MRSVSTTMPKARRTVFVTDEPNGRFDRANEDFAIIDARTVGLPRFRHCSFAFTAAELCFVLKPFCASHLQSVWSPSLTVYLDSDMFLYAEPSELLKIARDRGIALTPHITDVRCNADTSVPTMRSGLINGGAFAVDASATARAFLGWWGSQMAVPAKISANWFHDQGWLALVPALFPDYGLLRDPGYNIAFWNLHERRVATGKAGVPLAGSRPLVLFHFSMFDPDLPDRLTGRLQTNFPEPNTAVRSLLTEYAARLRAAGYDACRRWSYSYATFANGKPITAFHRRYFRERIIARLEESADPFDPRLRVPGYTGLKSLYHADHVVPRTVRQIRAGLREIRGSCRSI